MKGNSAAGNKQASHKERTKGNLVTGNKQDNNKKRTKK
jgi:hypothetical protein